jgi:hypothetical protein
MVEWWPEGMRQQHRDDQESVIERLGLNRRRPTAQPSTGPSIPMDPTARERAPVAGAACQCWVIDCPEAPGRWPGILESWQRGPKGWLGRVVLAAEGRHGWVSMTLWIEAQYLRPTDGGIDQHNIRTQGELNRSESE